jgi:hypothetical protein
VLLLHDEDGVSPTDMTLVDPDSCAWFRPGRFHHVAWKALVNGLSGQASQPILAANKQELGGLVHAALEWNNSLTEARLSTKIVNTPRTVPKGTDRHSTQAITKQKA